MQTILEHWWAHQHPVAGGFVEKQIRSAGSILEIVLWDYTERLAYPTTRVVAIASANNIAVLLCIMVWDNRVWFYGAVKHREIGCFVQDIYGAHHQQRATVRWCCGEMRGKRCFTMVCPPRRMVDSRWELINGPSSFNARAVTGRNTIAS